MPLFEPLDQYCERIAPGLWAEPLNAISNAAFFIAAWLLYRLYRQRGARDLPALAAIGLIAVVGAGSLAYHTFANVLTLWMDVIPIMIFVFTYLWLSLRRLAGASRVQAALGIASFILASAAFEQLPDEYYFNGSIAYAPCLLALTLLALALVKKNPKASRLLALAAAVFLVSLTLRSIDMAVCETLVIGTHLCWHLLNGLVLYLLARSLINKT